MRISEEALSKIKAFEGLRLEAYKCTAGVWTIGYGHTRGVKQGQRITAAQAETLLKGDLLAFEKYVDGLHLNLTQGAFDALVDFAFNCGTEALRRSTLLNKIRAKAPREEIKAEFMKWVRGGGKVLPGLVKRREWEAERFFN